MSLRILPPANSQERLARQRGLGSLRQQGLEVRAFAQFFWTMSRGLEYQDAALKDIFNLCLDNPLPQWEMEQLRILDFWNFSNYVHHRKDWQILSPPEATSTDQPTVTPSPNQNHVLPIPPTLKRRLRRKRASRNVVAITVSAESTAVTAEVGKSELVENATVTPESVESVPVIPKPAIPEPTQSAPFREPTQSAPFREPTQSAPFWEPTQSAPEPVPPREPTESAPEPAPPREPTESAPEPALPREPTESAPEPAPPREPTESAPEPAPPREPTESAPEPAPPREPTESAPEPAPPREPTEPAPVREPTESAPEPVPVWLPTELVLASRVMPTESSPASRTMPTEIIPELLVLPVMASAATLKQSVVIVPSMDDTEAVPKQPAFTATGSESAPVPESLESALECALVSDFAPVPEFTLELAPVLEPPKSILESTQEFISEQVPVQEQPENIPESVSEPVPVQKQSVSQSPNQKLPGCIPEPLPSESSTLSVSLVIGKKAVPCLAPRSPELPTFSISGVMASESTPKPILSPEPVPNAKVIPGPQAAASTIFKPPLFKPVNNPRYTTHVSPTPSSMQPNTCGFPTPPAAFHSALPGYNTGFIPNLPTPSPGLHGGYGSAMPAPFKPAQLIPPLFPVASPPPWTGLDARRHPLGGGYCQGSALAALSVLSLFNVSLVVLCLNTLLCLCLCLPCIPVIPPPCFPWSRPLV